MKHGTTDGREPWTRDRLRTLRERYGLTQAKFAMSLDLHPATVAKWECGSANPDAAWRSLLRLVERKCITLEQARP
jgi:DNA-binding transcriptional regulator YiaG